MDRQEPDARRSIGDRLLMLGLALAGDVVVLGAVLFMTGIVKL